MTAAGTSASVDLAGSRTTAGTSNATRFPSASVAQARPSGVVVTRPVALPDALTVSRAWAAAGGANTADSASREVQHPAPKTGAIE